MRFPLFLLLLLACLSFSVAMKSYQPHSQTPVLEKISQFISDRDVDGLASLFGQQVEINLDGQVEAYAPAQARQVLKTFVAQHPPQAFSFAQQGNTSLMLYGVGTYQTQGSRYEIDVYLKKATEEDTYLIEQMRIERK